MHLARRRRARAFYTTPIKALSNQKFGDFIVEYGHDLVGLLTGDNSINGGAPIVVMTTEVLRNMIYAGSRGPRPARRWWCSTRSTTSRTGRAGRCGRRSSSTLPATSNWSGLSATIANAAEFAAWVETRRGADAARRGDVATGAAGEPVHGQGPLVAAVGRMYDDLSGERSGTAPPNPAVQRCSPKVGAAGGSGHPAAPRRWSTSPRRGCSPPSTSSSPGTGASRAATPDRRRGVSGSTTPDEREEIVRTAAAPAPPTSGTAT